MRWDKILLDARKNSVKAMSINHLRFLRKEGISQKKSRGGGGGQWSIVRYHVQFIFYLIIFLKLQTFKKNPKFYHFFSFLKIQVISKYHQGKGESKNP